MLILGLTLLLAQPPAGPVLSRTEGQLTPLPVTQIDDRPGVANLDAPRRVSLAFAEPMPVRDVLLLLVRDTPFSIAFDPDINGTFIGELKEVTLRQAIDAVLTPRGFDYDVRGTLIRVFVRRTDTRLFDLNVLNVQRTWQRTVSSGDGTTLTSVSGRVDPLDDIEKGIESLLSPSGRAHVDRRSGLAQVTDFPDRLDRVGLYLEALQIRAGRQIRLQGRVLEVTLRDKPSVDWKAVRQELGLPASSAAAGITASDAASIQEALSAQGDVRVLATPDVTAMNNEAAVLRVGTPDVSSFTLTVIPQISSDGFVQLSVSPSWAERAGMRQSDGHTVPAMRVSEADTVARVTDGYTVLLAGLPGGADATKPGGFGAIFGTQPKPARPAELIVLLTPTVIPPAAPAAGSR